jgi:hypothetical protein
MAMLIWCRKMILLEFLMVLLMSMEAQSKVLLDPKEMMVLRVHKAVWGHKDRRVFKVFKVCKEKKATKVRQDRKDLQALKVFKVQKAILEILGHKAPKASRVQLV